MIPSIPFLIHVFCYRFKAQAKITLFHRHYSVNKHIIHLFFLFFFFTGVVSISIKLLLTCRVRWTPLEVEEG